MGLRDSLVKLKQAIIPSSEVLTDKQMLDTKSSLQESQESKEDSDEDVEEDQPKFDTARLAESDSDSDGELNEPIANDLMVDEADERSDEEEEEEEVGDEEDEEDEEEDVPLSDVELDDDADVVPFQKTTINNKAALKQAVDTIKLKSSNFYNHLSITSTDPMVLKDIYDDFERELAFYKQGQTAAADARKKLRTEKIPFTRPTDFFAEMVKSDEHMERLRMKLIDEETAKKAGQEARRQRELKKFGKKVQHARLQERQKEKRETLDRIKALKRKRGTGGDMTSNEEFDIALEEAASSSSNKTKGAKRQAKDAKYGHGGKKRFKNSNDAESTADMSGFSSKKMKASSRGKVNRPGKSKRANRR